MSNAPLMLSVSGLRGLVGQSLTPAVAARYAAAFGQWLKSTQPAGGPPPQVVLGRDSRPSGQMLELAAASGLIAAGCRVVALGLAATPTVAVMVEHRRAAGGMVITASHNPIAWNGIKALRHDGVAPPPDQAAQIIRRFHDDAVDYAPVAALLPLEQDAQGHRIHVDRVLAGIDVAAVRRARLKVVLDSVHGAGGLAGALLLEALGVELVHLYAQPTGLFPHTPEPTRENLVGLCQAVRQHRADIGLAQDPDADRLAVVDEQGTYIGEEYTLALAVMWVLERGDAGSTVNPGAAGGAARPAGPLSVAANLSTSRMIDDVAARHGARVLRTAVGEANVAAAMRQAGSTIGGEGNGGVIWPRVVMVRDSLGGMALLLEMLARRRQPLSQVAAAIPRYAIVKDKADLRPDLAGRLAPLLRERFAGQRLDTQDGVRIDWPEGWVHVRPSNTEPIMRLIAEARDEPAAHRLLAQVRQALGM